MPPRVSVILSPQAHRDRDAVIDYLWAHHAQDAAIRFLDELDAVMAQLSDFPKSGRVVVSSGPFVIRKANMRGFPERVFYTYDDSVLITRILSAVRNIQPEDLY